MSGEANVGDVFSFDYHTHNLDSVPGKAIVNLPREVVEGLQPFCPVPGMLYSAGIHPWWLADGCPSGAIATLPHLLQSIQVVAVGECGFDRLRGGEWQLQCEVFEAQVRMAERLHLPLTIHCVKAYDSLLAAVKKLRPTTIWTVHGFRGKPALARQLIDAGLDLSFGQHFNPASLAACPEGRFHIETDDSGLPLSEVVAKVKKCL